MYQGKDKYTETVSKLTKYIFVAWITEQVKRRDGNRLNELRVPVIRIWEESCSPMWRDTAHKWRRVYFFFFCCNNFGYCYTLCFFVVVGVAIESATKMISIYLLCFHSESTYIFLRWIFLYYKGERIQMIQPLWVRWVKSSTLYS